MHYGYILEVYNRNNEVSSSKWFRYSSQAMQYAEEHVTSLFGERIRPATKEEYLARAGGPITGVDASERS